MELSLAFNTIVDAGPQGQPKHRSADSGSKAIVGITSRR